MILVRTLNLNKKLNVKANQSFQIVGEEKAIVTDQDGNVIDESTFTINVEAHCDVNGPWEGKEIPGVKIVHPAAYEVGNGETRALYRCPYCHHEWYEELPQ